MLFKIIDHNYNRRVQIASFVLKKEILKVSAKYQASTGGRYSNGISPNKQEGRFNASSQYICSTEFSDIIRGLGNNPCISFNKELNGSNLLILGPRPDALEILAFSNAFPDIANIHAATASLHNLIDIFRQPRLTGAEQPPVYLHYRNIMELPDILTNYFHLVYSFCVFDSLYFDEKQLRQCGKEIVRVLQPGGISINLGFIPVFDKSDVIELGMLRRGSNSICQKK
ncbi:class I SAM-dependent methyltransferase [Candidatus Margulisiibacteriota bacterium]